MSGVSFLDNAVIYQQSLLLNMYTKLFVGGAGVMAAGPYLPVIVPGMQIPYVHSIVMSNITAQNESVSVTGVWDQTVFIGGSFLQMPVLNHSSD